MSFGKSNKDDSANSGTAIGAVGSYSSSLGSDPSKLEAFLGKGAKIVGNLTFTGPVEVDGYVEGEINAKDRIIVGESAVVNARIVGVDVVVRGTVNGDISANKISLRKPARILGNITSSNLSIEEGVVFEGKCSMSASGSDNKVGMPPKVVSAPKVGASA